MTALGLLSLVAAAAAAATARRVWRSAARASHEVRGPLTVALLALDGMVERGEIGREAGLGLELQLRRARHGLDDLACVRGARPPDRLEPVPVGALLAQIASAWRPVAAARGVELCVTGAAGALLADRDRLAQAVGNLLSNALEHGAGPVHVCARNVGAHMRLEVRDGGPGLREPIRSLSRRPRGGRGHGLAIASSIAERHGGRLVAAPTTAGATVALELPLRDPAEIGLEGAG